MWDMFHILLLLFLTLRQKRSASPTPQQRAVGSYKSPSAIITNSGTERLPTLRRMWQPNAALVPVDLVKCDRGGGVDAIEALEQPVLERGV